MHIITIELAKAEKLAREKAEREMQAVEAWAIFLRYHRDKEKRELVNGILREKEDIAMAGEAAQGFTQEQLEYFHNLSKLKYELDLQDLKAWQRREGREEEKRETARRFKAMGLSPAQIAEGVGLTPEEIEKL